MSDDSVFPQPGPYHETTPLGGLTKRELFAAMAMQGVLASKHRPSVRHTATDAIEYADALIAELAKPVKP